MKLKNRISKIYQFLVVALLAGAVTACSPDDPDASLGPLPTSEMVKFTATPSADNPNIINFTNQTPGSFKAIWDLGNSTVADGNQVSGTYAVAGDYTVKLTIFTSGGYATNTQTIHIENTDVSLLDRDDYNMLTGGADDEDGKTWVIESGVKGHLGVGDATAANPSSNWWAAGINEKAGVGVYDDEMTFKLDGFTYTYNNHGDTYANAGYAADLGGKNGDADVTVAYTPPTDMKWSITEEGGKKYLNLSNNGFLAYYVGVSKYQILSQSEDEMYLMSSQKGVPGNAWFYRLARKGYEPPVVARPIKMDDIFDNFDQDGNITWKKEALLLNENYDNPAPIAPNTSAKVAMYVKQDGKNYEFANMFTDFSYNFDLTNRHVFKLLVYVPSYNDFTTAAGEDWANKNLLKQVSMKLQDGTSAQPWVNQVEIKQQVSQLDRWVELTFDFSAADVVSRKDLNRIVIQVGGEGNYVPGIFFLDDFRLEK
ncbi:PKD domain-containing protein [Pontibacter chitinilyticus]|uniref:PKD domain-containing protein n=1 Tax=Pontibacter chitinilyticus TaxID=2674989 RepID=UPI0032191A0D